jgi:GDP-L-fucose synthase
MNKSSKIYAAGHRGLVGSAVMRVLEAKGYTNVVTRRSSELDLRKQAEVEEFFEAEKPEYVFLCAARVGGIMANSTYKGDFIYDNIMIASNVINAARLSGVKKLINLGSSCIYPKLAPQPLKEEYLMTGPLEPTNEPYAIAKILAIKLCRYFNEQYGTNFLSVMPSNLYGPNDNFDLETSHVLPAMIRRFHEASTAKKSGTKAGASGEEGADGTLTEEAEVVLWGDGSPRREFLYVDDLADALLFLMERKNADEIGEFINIGTGEDVTINELASRIAKITDYRGEIEWDTSKPNGTPRKLLDVSRMRDLGWVARTSLWEGLEKAYRWYLENGAKK